MKNLPRILAAGLVFIGVVFLYVGYSAPARQEDWRVARIEARADVARIDASVNAKYNVEDSEIKKQLKSFSDSLSDDWDKRHADMTGLIQYCTGWLLIGMGVISFSIASKT